MLLSDLQSVKDEARNKEGRERLFGCSLSVAQNVDVLVLWTVWILIRISFIWISEFFCHMNEVFTVKLNKCLVKPSRTQCVMFHVTLRPQSSKNVTHMWCVMPSLVRFSAAISVVYKCFYNLFMI